MEKKFGGIYYKIRRIGAFNKAKHINELKKDDATNVRIDYKVSGIGSGSCRPQPTEKYQLTKGEDIDFSFYIITD